MTIGVVQLSSPGLFDSHLTRQQSRQSDLDVQGDPSQIQGWSGCSGWSCGLPCTRWLHTLVPSQFLSPCAHN